MRSKLAGPADEAPLYAPVLVAERYLKMEDLFAVALEPEMARLYHAGVYRAHGHLVDFRTVYPEKICRSRRNRGARFQRIAHRLKPGVSVAPEACLLRYLAFEQVELGEIGRERAEGIPGGHGQHFKPPLRVKG